MFYIWKKRFDGKLLTVVTCRSRSVVSWLGGGGGFLVLMVLKGKLTVWRPNALSTVAQLRGIWNWPASSSLRLSLHVLKLALQARKRQNRWQGLQLANLSNTHKPTNGQTRTCFAEDSVHALAAAAAADGGVEVGSMHGWQDAQVWWQRRDAGVWRNSLDV